MKKTKLGDIVIIESKSKIKKKEGLEKGKFPFFTSDMTQSKWVNEEQFFGESIILGTGIKASVHYVNEPFSTSDDCLVIKSKIKDVNIKFVYYFLYSNTKILEQSLKKIKSESGLQKRINNIIIDIPDLETQNRAVAILDKVQSIITNRRRIEELYGELLESYFLKIFGNPMQRPNKWSLNSIGDSLKKLSAGRSYPGIENKPLDNDELGVLKTSSVSKGTFISSEYKAVKSENIKHSVIHPKKGDLLFNRANTLNLVGSSCIVDEDYDNLFLPDKIWKIETDETKIKKTYLHYVLQNKDFRKALLPISIGSSSSMLNISQSNFKKIVIPYPPLELQNDFEKIYFKYEGLRKALRESHQNFSDLFKSVFNLAFTDRLDFNVAADLEMLLENDYEYFREHSNPDSVRLLLERLNKDYLNNNKFHNSRQYDKAKEFVFELLKDGIIKQVFDEKYKIIKLSVQ